MNTQANSPEFAELHAAVSAIASVCDGAHTKDGEGFNGQDTKFGKRAADIPAEEWSTAIAADVYAMLRTYRGQLAGFGINYDDLTPVRENAQHNAGRNDARNITYQKTHAPYLTIAQEHDGLVMRVWNSYPIKNVLKANGFLFGRRGTKTWDAIVAPSSAATVLGIPEIQIDDEFKADLMELAEKAGDDAPSAEHFDIRIHDGQIVIDVPFGKIPLPIMRGIPGRRWDGAQKLNFVKPHFGLLKLAQEFKLTISPDALQAIEDAREMWQAEQNAFQAAVAGSIATDTDLTADDMALFDDLYKFQRAGVAYALKHLGGTLFADEMGLGKTRQALATAETAKAFPLLIVVPASAKYVWLREIERLLPHRSAAVYFGRIKPDEIFDMPEEIIILGYPSVQSYLHNLPELGGVVCDESHYIKNPKAGRTQAVMTIYGHGHEKDGTPIPGKLRTHSPMRLMLTGTPVLNRPAELVQPLLALGILTEQKGRENSVGKFLYTYCDPQGTKGRMNFNGLTPGMGEALNEYLRRECMVRRTKTQVLTDLPPKTRSQQFIQLDDRAATTYAMLEKQAAEAAAESRAAAIVYLNKLRSAIGTSKIHMAVNWITEMMETTDESLVVFATHKDVQRGIIQALKEYDESLSAEDESNRTNVTYILGAQSAKLTEEMKEVFQARESRVIVLSFDAAREAHTLTAASNVLFVEYGWNPGTQNQAEDRAHRIGQDKPVTVYYLCGMDTIDEWSYELVESKREVVDAVTDGRMAEEAENTLFVQMVDKLTAKHGITRTWSASRD